MCEKKPPLHVKVAHSTLRKNDDVTSDFDNILVNAKDYGILFIPPLFQTIHNIIKSILKSIEGTPQ